MPPKKGILNKDLVVEYSTFLRDWTLKRFFSRVLFPFWAFSFGLCVCVWLVSLFPKKLGRDQYPFTYFSLVDIWFHQLVMLRLTFLWFRKTTGKAKYPEVTVQQLKFGVQSITTTYCETGVQGSLVTDTCSASVCESSTVWIKSSSKGEERWRKRHKNLLGCLCEGVSNTVLVAVTCHRGAFQGHRDNTRRGQMSFCDAYTAYTWTCCQPHVGPQKTNW